ncbi:MAG: hypothetical protein HYZ45_00880 [Burkholderiales bacterium]|nr:hypothetical protein [Burkholderiales bacterium]
MLYTVTLTGGATDAFSLAATGLEIFGWHVQTAYGQHQLAHNGTVGDFSTDYHWHYRAKLADIIQPGAVPAPKSAAGRMRIFSQHPL